MIKNCVVVLVWDLHFLLPPLLSVSEDQNRSGWGEENREGEFTDADSPGRLASTI